SAQELLVDRQYARLHGGWPRAAGGALLDGDPSGHWLRHRLRPHADLAQLGEAQIADDLAHDGGPPVVARVPLNRSSDLCARFRKRAVRPTSPWPSPPPAADGVAAG